MFLTTVRIRRARKTNLEGRLNEDQMMSVQSGSMGDLIEVMAHSFPIAIVKVDQALKGEPEAILWADARAEDPEAMVKLVQGAVAMMSAAEKGGLTS